MNTQLFPIVYTAIKGFFPRRSLAQWSTEGVSPASSVNSLILGDGLDGLVGDAPNTPTVSAGEQGLYPQVTSEPEPVQQHEVITRYGFRRPPDVHLV